MSFEVKETTKYIAIDLNDNTKIVAEGETFEATTQKASLITHDYSIMYVPNQGQTYIF